MEILQYKFSYEGKGFDFFKIKIINALLCIVTLGIYYPWAKAKTIQYLYSQTNFQDSPFVFTGTGNQMFRGFLKLIVFFIIYYAVIITISMFVNISLGVLLAYLILFSLVPFALHAFFKFRMSKTKWQGINFSYEGKLGNMCKIYFTGLFFTIITLGIYGAWLSMNLRRYIIGNIYVGNARMNYKGDGAEYFALNIIGYLLTLVTLGVYYFWWQKDLYNYFVNNINLTDGEKVVIVKTNVSGGDFAGLIIGNFFIVLFTLGLGTAWAITRKLRFYAKHIDMYGDLDFNILQQVETEEYADATGDDLSGVLDIGSFI